MKTISAILPFMNQIPRRCWIYGLTAIFHLIFTIVFPFYSVALVSWFQKRHLYQLLIVMVSIPFFAALCYYTAKRWSVIRKSRKTALCLAVSAILYVTVYETVPDFGEKLHVLNFSVLAILFYKAFSPIMKIPEALFWSWYITNLTGSLDESLQNFIIGRDGSIHDVLICVRSATLGIIIAWIFDAYSRKGRNAKPLPEWA